MYKRRDYNRLMVVKWIVVIVAMVLIAYMVYEFAVPLLWDIVKDVWRRDFSSTTE